MNRALSQKMAEAQLESARGYRSRAILCALDGDDKHAQTYFAYAKRCLYCAKLFLHDGHAGEYDQLHLRRGNANDSN